MLAAIDVTFRFVWVGRRLTQGGDLFLDIKFFRVSMTSVSIPNSNEDLVLDMKFFRVSFCHIRLKTFF